MYIKSLNNTSTKFLFFLLCTYNLKFLNVGSTQPLVKQSDIQNLTFLIPSFSAQKAIAEVLSSLDEKIDLLHRQNKTLENMAQTLFRKWFVENKGKRKEKPLGETVDISIGRTPPRNEFHWFSRRPDDWKWLSIKDMAESGVYLFSTSERLTQKAVDKFNIPIIAAHTVILSFKMTVGRVGITAENMLSNEAIAQFKFKSDTPYSKEYLYFFLKMFRFESLGSTSSIVTSINTRMIKSIKIPIPEIKLGNGFATTCKPLFNKIYSNQVKIRTLENLRDILLPKLMSGNAKIKA